MRRSRVLRDRGIEPAVTTMELFFDVVYVFAVTQLSQTLVEHLSVRGAIETLVVFAGVWWAWNLTTWATNWIDPDTLPVRALMVMRMLLSLVMSASIPKALEDRALSFVGAYREAAADARSRGWPVEEIPGAQHLHIVVAPAEVGDALLRLAIA